VKSVHAIGIGALIVALGIMAGAFGAHALKERLDSYLLGVYEKAVFYQLLHGVGILCLGLIAETRVLPEDEVARTVLLLLVGTIIFSGTLYGVSVFGVRWLGAVTPIGGSLMIIGWCYLTFSAFRRQ
jgi:uncharacterized membrane protein YgdD (TMEM256/DUF423 family)